MNDKSILTKAFKKSFEEVFKKHVALLSHLSVWEIGMLVDKERIELDRDVLEWIDRALELPGLSLSPITTRIAILSTRLPGEIHFDPVDRLLIATAHEENAVLITCDKKILNYGKGKFISVLDPST